MKNYTSPTIEDLSIIPEGIFASGTSGGVTPPPPPKYSYTVEKWWGGHNTGHHSSPHVIVHVSVGGSYISRVTIQFVLKVKYIEHGISASGPLSLISTTNDTDSIVFSANVQNSSENLHISLNGVHFENPDTLYDSDGNSLDSYRHLSGETPNYDYLDEITVIVE